MKIKKPEHKYFVMLLNETAKTFGFEQEYVALKRADVISIQEAVNFHVKQHNLLEDFPETYAVSTDRVLNTYRGHLRKDIVEIPCSEKILNSIVHYATGGAITHWSLYKMEKMKLDAEGKASSKAVEKTSANPSKSRPLSVVVEIPDADFYKEDVKEEWMVYELAFLWLGKEPPSIAAHFYQMTREMEVLKTSLHAYVERGLLQATTIKAAGGVTRFITRVDLEAFLKANNQERPEFLKREKRR